MAARVKKARRRRRKDRPRIRPKLRVAILATLGSIALLVGAFAPCVRVDFRGNLSYWDIAGLEVFAVLAAALGTLAITGQRRHHGWMVVTTAVLWGGLIYPYLTAHVLPKSTFFGRVRRAVTNTFTDTGGDMLLTFHMVHFSWGAALLCLGVAMVTVATVLVFG